MLSNDVLAILEQNKRLQSELIHKDWIIKKLRHQIYGSQSEKVTTAESEQYIFNEIEKEADINQPVQTQLIDGYSRKKGKSARKAFPDSLEREEVIIDLPDAEKICPYDQSFLKEIGFEITEKLKTYPARAVVLVEKKKKYACPCCDKHLAQAITVAILPKTIATPELLSFLIFSKFFQGLPLYRVEELFKLQGIELSRGRMASWLIQVSEKLQPIWNILEERALASGYMTIDATHVQVLKEEGRTAETKSFMWARGSPEKGIVLFDYDISGGGHVAKKLMQGFEGILQGDAHRGYNALDRKSLLLIGCMSHARRRFHQAWLEAKKQPGLAENTIKMFKRLYKFEEAYKLQNLSSQERFAARELEVKPYLEKIRSWCEERRSSVLKSSPLGNAINYFINEYAELSGFLKDGRTEIDNNWMERAIRKFGIGRNNWLFCDTVAGANASSLLYSLVITAKLNNKDPFKVMCEIFYEVPKAKTVDDYERLANLFLTEKTLQ